MEDHTVNPEELLSKMSYEQVQKTRTQMQSQCEAAEAWGISEPKITLWRRALEAVVTKLAELESQTSELEGEMSDAK